MRLSSRKLQRSGAHAVEFALIVPIVLGLIFSVLEYSRYLMVRHLTENSVREGARFAVARTDTLQTNVTDTVIQDEVKKFLSQANVNLSGIDIKVYKSNQSGQPLDLNGNVVSSVASAAKFDQTKFGDYITVTLTGNFSPVLPSFLMMAPNMEVTAFSVMCSEGN